MDEAKYLLRSLRSNDLSDIGVGTVEVLLELITQGEASSRQLSEALDVPHNRVIMRLTRLQERGLAKVSQINKPSGKRGKFSIYIYMPTFRAAEVLGL